MNDADLLARAEKAGLDYKAVYGKYPEKMGIHYRRLATFRPSIVFVDLPQREIKGTLAEAIASLPSDVDAIMLYRYTCMFEPVAGQNIRWNEVYLPIPGDDMRAISAERMARIVEGQEPAPIKQADSPYLGGEQ